MPAFVIQPPRRPGDRREWLPMLCAPVELAGAAASRGLSGGGAGGVVFEATLARAALTELGLAQGWDRLLAQAEQQRFTVPLPGPYRRYREHLLQAHERELDLTELDEPVAIPLRLFPRVLGLDYAESFRAVAV